MFDFPAKPRRFDAFMLFGRKEFLIELRDVGGLLALIDQSLRRDLDHIGCPDFALRLPLGGLSPRANRSLRVGRRQ
jgi:hypothetical protein